MKSSIKVTGIDHVVLHRPPPSASDAGGALRRIDSKRDTWRRG